MNHKFEISIAIVAGRLCPFIPCMAVNQSLAHSDNCRVSHKSLYLYISRQTISWTPQPVIYFPQQFILLSVKLFPLASTRATLLVSTLLSGTGSHLKILLEPKPAESIPLHCWRSYDIYLSNNLSCSRYFCTQQFRISRFLLNIYYTTVYS